MGGTGAAGGGVAGAPSGIGGVGEAGADAGADGGATLPLGTAGCVAAGAVGELVAVCSIGAVGGVNEVAGVALPSGAGGGWTGACIPVGLGPVAPLSESGLGAWAPCGPWAPWPV